MFLCFLKHRLSTKKIRNRVHVRQQIISMGHFCRNVCSCTQWVEGGWILKLSYLTFLPHRCKLLSQVLNHD